MARALALALTLVVTLDFSTPSVPGALAFDRDQCVDATVRASGVEIDGLAAAPTRVASRVPIVISDDTPARAPVTGWSGPPRPRRQQARVAEAGAPSPTDH